MVFFKKTGMYMLKAGGQILQYGVGEAPITIKWEQPNHLEILLNDYYAGRMD